jgi:hypothetical protein
MRSFFAALKSLVLPYGVTTGPRIVLDGINGVIEVYNSTGLIGRIDTDGLLIQQQGQIALSGPNNNGIYLLNNSGQPSILFVGKDGTTSGTIAFDTTSTPGGFVMWVTNGLGSLGADATGWYFNGDTTGTGVKFEPISASLKALVGGAVETWHDVALLNGWANRAAPWAHLSYKKMPDNTVRLQGSISGGTSASGTKIGTIPAGYRPTQEDAVHPIASDNLPAAYASANGVPRLQVTNGGDMFIYGTGTGPLYFTGFSWSLD